ncbi:hypothetical protein [Rhabdothermincola salaria]|uniref:hypothetical protein n=1 Tax=Rhabdothermincola salaria TaxID=2903142 RepID=UPI001E3CB82B|nr:hypothetical protein [Rhabdothermincola salaria]MCD9625686.1 hypothetical protein [Rhabdothermincola salaria]
MSDAAAITPIGRVTAVFEPDTDPNLRCSHCDSVMTDDDAQCPTCDSPIDWGASHAALRDWTKSTTG